MLLKLNSNQAYIKLDSFIHVIVLNYVTILSMIYLILPLYYCNLDCSNICSLNTPHGK